MAKLNSRRRFSVSLEYFTQNFQIGGSSIKVWERKELTYVCLLSNEAYATPNVEKDIIWQSIVGLLQDSPGRSILHSKESGATYRYSLIFCLTGQAYKESSAFADLAFKTYSSAKRFSNTFYHSQSETLPFSFRCKQRSK